MENRKKYLASVRNVVVKLGTQLLSDGHKRLDTTFLKEMARQVVRLREQGIHVTIVSSGAVGAGLAELNLSKRPTNLAQLQAVAAVGQRRLMDAWGEAFEAYGLPVAQLLLTRDDIDNRTRFLNLRNTISAIQELGGVPIINENDTVSTDEIVKITFGDNDILAALVTEALGADLLVLLTVVDGLLDRASKPVRLVNSVEQAQALVRSEKSAAGKGGMDSKLRAADMVTECGQAMVVANGRSKSVLLSILSFELVGTLFVPYPKKRTARTRWIGSARPVGAVVVDDGAVTAVVKKNRSLLPAGVVSVEGLFEQGDLIAIKAPDGRMIARGLSNYSSAGVEQVLGKKTSEVRSLLGKAAYDEVIHRNNMVVE
ncbi:MAG TPA: glutamate 5-kinase [Tepidisphaeraceae bacterium]|nr:glutamate 5-kinase [Tepidisphaeraceae bacterium]